MLDKYATFSQRDVFHKRVYENQDTEYIMQWLKIFLMQTKKYPPMLDKIEFLQRFSKEI